MDMPQLQGRVPDKDVRGSTLDISQYDVDEPEDFTPESYDEYLTAQVLLPQGDEASKATVV